MVPRSEGSPAVSGVTDAHDPVDRQSATEVSGTPSPEPVQLATPGTEAVRAVGRDRYLDLLRAIALVRVVAYHAFGGVAFGLVFPSLGVMFALAGSLMASSLDRRPTLGVLRSRTRRLLLPLWVYALTALVLLFAQGWTPAQDGGSWGSVLLWFVPVGDPPFPETLGDGLGGLGPEWSYETGVTLWYIRAYFWFLLLSPLLLRAFRAWPGPVLLAPLFLLAALELAPVSVPGPAAAPLWDVAIYGSCWLLGFAHHDGLLRRIPARVVFTAGPVVMALGLWWALAHADGPGWEIDQFSAAQGLWSFGFSAMLLRISPEWSALPRPLRFLDRFVTLINNRALTVYLWHNLLLVFTWVLLGLLGEIAAVSAGTPWLLDSSFASFILVWPLLGVACLAVGWVEDVAAKRRMRLWPDDRKR